MKRILPICVLLILSCSSKTDFSSYISNIATEPSQENISAFITAVHDDASKNDTDKAIESLAFGLENSVKLEIPEGKKAFLSSLLTSLKSNNSDPNMAIQKLIDVTINHSPNPMQLDSLLYYIADISTTQGVNGGLNKSIAEDYITASNLMLSSVQGNDKKADLLFKCAEMANAIGDPNRAITFFDQVLKDYNTSEKAPLSLFLKGFTYENNLEDIDNAKIYYQSFLDQYPDHKMANDVKFLVQNLGISGEDLIKAARLNQNQ